MGLPDHTFVLFIQHPTTCALSRFHFRMKACRGLALQGRNLEEGEVRLPSPHRCLQRVLSLFNSTRGQRAEYLHSLPAVVQIPDVSSPPLSYSPL